MNIILVLIDSVNRNALSAYGGTEFATPNLQSFAQKAWRFDNHFVGSLPCMPARREIFAGFSGMQWRPWGPLEPFDLRLPKLLESAGYTTAIVTDHYHYWEESANGYIQSFQGAEFIRGHELDFWQPLVPEADLPQWAHNIEKWRPGYGHRYFSNVANFNDEADFFPAKVMTSASEWLAKPKTGKPFFLQVESFDVHEPFDVPEPYASMYGDGAARDRFTLWPPYQDAARQAEFMSQASPEELAFVRSQYGAKLTMTDRWLGKLFTTLDELQLWDDTAIIVTTDHGHDLGERGGYGKQFPHFDSHANIPLLVWHPGFQANGGAIQNLTSTVDLFASILAIAGVEPPRQTHSHSFLPLLKGDTSNARNAVIYGTFGQGICCTDGEWTLIQPPDREKPLYAYSTMVPTTIEPQDKPVDHGHYIPGIDMPQWKIPITPDRPGDRRNLDSQPLLYDRRNDPGQKRDLWHDRPEERGRMSNLMRQVIEQYGAPAELFQRLGLD
ncbi:sulfatase [Rhizobium leguminosarum]|uniref:sulfatase n=1 Tax=Rhizobium leguminosarum TaxID=384 RepID=UPI001C950D24|nr:sulfatase [Rhizobium leguminosarum]MBY5610384.1 sulfatase [Rhizobium leguminosarum]MBY5614519.1 sulfatase [Rhizobium leguminosarum]MBY5656086.1 sulfatase [Rhizobium leguminosarum]